MEPKGFVYKGNEIWLIESPRKRCRRWHGHFPVICDIGGADPSGLRKNLLQKTWEKAIARNLKQPKNMHFHRIVLGNGCAGNQKKTGVRNLLQFEMQVLPDDAVRKVCRNSLKHDDQ